MGMPGEGGGMRGSGGGGGGHARIGGRGGRGSGPHRKITRYMGRSRSPTLDEISWFRAWGGGGNLFHWDALEQIA